MKLISFSIYGSNPKYANAAILNSELAKEIYPGWKCRFYVDETVPKDLIEFLSKDDNNEVWEMPKAPGHLGAFWRFNPLDDRNVERFIVRDTDSRLNPREADAVNEWIESGKPFHLMRDNVQHDPVPICAGMWGATTEFRPNFSKLHKEWLSGNQHRAFGHPRGQYFYMDQLFLAEKIWPLVINKHIAHVSYNSKWPGDKRPFRVANPDGSFVGQDFDFTP